MLLLAGRTIAGFIPDIEATDVVSRIVKQRGEGFMAPFDRLDGELPFPHCALGNHDFETDEH